MKLIRNIQKFESSKFSNFYFVFNVLNYFLLKLANNKNHLKNEKNWELQFF